MLPACHRRSGVFANSVADRFFFRRGLGRGLILILLSLLCLNVAVISLIDSYEVRFAFVHLTAHGAFKPILMMNGCFLVALMVCGAGQKARENIFDSIEKRLGSPARYRAALICTVILLVLAIYLPATGIDIFHQEWTQKHVSAEKKTLLSLAQFFTQGDPTGFYRPLGFISLWLDYQLFGDAYAGYYAQSIVLHLVNALLAAWLALSLGFSRKCSCWAGTLFAAAAVNFEAVIWPAARFDLLATLFTMLALILIIRYLRDARLWAWTLPASVLSFIFGIMSKESAYCFPLLLILLLCTYSLWNIPRPTRAKLALCLLLVAAATVLMLSVRIAVYGSLGGYPTAAGVQSFHFRINLKTFTSLVRAMPIPLLGVNTSSAVRVWGSFVPILFTIPVLITAFLCRGCFRQKEYALMILLVLAMAPALNIIGWIGSWMQHSRYLYMPTVFVMLLLASVVSKMRWSTGLLGAFLLINAFGAASNVRVYRDMLAKADSLADAVYSDWKHRPALSKIGLLNLPEHTDGVFYFGSEVADRIQSRIQGATIIRLESYDPVKSDAAAQWIYQWKKETRSLQLVAGPK